MLGGVDSLSAELKSQSLMDAFYDLSLYPIILCKMAERGKIVLNQPDSHHGNQTTLSDLSWTHVHVFSVSLISILTTVLAAKGLT
jgi:hypothetical protein